MLSNWRLRYKFLRLILLPRYWSWAKRLCSLVANHRNGFKHSSARTW